MCDLSSCTFQGSYDTNFSDDVVSEFYIPALSNSIYYDRMSGFFSSTSLSVAAEGVERMIKNNGRMRLITCPLLTEGDVEILNSYSNDPKALEEKLSSALTKAIDADFIESESAEALGWMLLKGYLEIRIVLVKRDGSFLNSKKIDDEGIFHNKIGILKDRHGNIVTFSGSINESLGGWKKNIESFEVFCSWESGTAKHIEPHIKRFEQYWEYGQAGNSITVPLPEAVKKYWIKSIPSDQDDLKIFRNKIGSIRLRKYQSEAIECWLKNGCVGLFNMATGTGKTITATLALREVINNSSDKFLIVIAVPSQHLIEDPWHKNINEFITTTTDNCEVIEAFSGNGKWFKQLSDCKMDLRLGLLKILVVITTYDTLSSQRFINGIHGTQATMILIADEVHNAGASTFRNGLIEDYQYRLGLSATPARYLDDDGTNVLWNYFNKEVFTFSLEDAITKINPDSGKTYLTPYYYYPIPITLTKEELESYSNLSSKIAKLSSIEEKTPEIVKSCEFLLIQRSKIIKNACNKIPVFEENIPKLKKDGIFDHCLIYCSDGKDPNDETTKTINTIIGILNRHNITNRRFTSDDKFSIRPQILDKFADGSVSTLVAIKCLDEGVDIPATKSAIIMASTGNPREYIQRRGRILRPFEGKEYAILFDFIVVPSGSPDYFESESRIFESEIERFFEFSKYSLNHRINVESMNKIAKKYRITMVNSNEH